jgi:hypothetical protein
MAPAKARMEVYTNLPARHARGCPCNILRAVRWQLATCDLDARVRMRILSTIKAVLPCTCPKGDEKQSKKRR